MAAIYGHFWNFKSCTVNSWFKKDLKLQIHLHKAFFSDDQFLNSLQKSFLSQTTFDLRKKKWTFLNREFTVLQFLSKWLNKAAMWNGDNTSQIYGFSH